MSVREPWLDTGGAVRPLPIAIFSWIAEQERSRLSERTKAGMELARRDGVHIGRPAVRVDVRRARALRAEGLPLREVASRLRVSLATLKRTLGGSKGVHCEGVVTPRKNRHRASGSKPTPYATGVDYGPTLPTDPTDEALARDWTLSASDFEEVRRCRGDDNRRRFAIQLCALRAFGCFVDDVGRVPVRIANHVGRQVGVPPALFLSDPDRAATDTAHTQRIRAYLGYRAFDDDALARLRTVLEERAATGVLPAEIDEHARVTLRAWKVEIPAARRLNDSSPHAPRKRRARCGTSSRAAYRPRSAKRSTPSW